MSVHFARPRGAASSDPEQGVVRGYRRRRRTYLAAAAGAAVLLAVAIATVNAAAQDTAADNTIKAAAFGAQSGALTQPTGDTGGGLNVGWLANGDWMRYDGVDLGVAGTVTTSVRVAAAYPLRTGTVEVRLDSLTGQLVASIPVAGTGGWQTWVTKTDTQPSPGGTHQVFLVMRSAQPMDFVNVNWFSFQATASGATPSASTVPSASGAAGASASASASAVASAPASAPAGGWVDVDQAAWQQELATFDAIAQLPVPAGTTRVPEFHTDCTMSGQAPDDPIVFPGIPGASHLHTFFGPTVDAFTKTTDLPTKATTCNAPGDNAAYWVPTLLRDGNPVTMKSFRVYYGSRLSDPSTVKPFPPGLVMVQGDAKRQVATPANASGQFWCAGSAEIGRSADGNWPVCAAGGNLIFQLTFQDCWDGKHIDSPDHKSHMGPAQNGVCTGAYPVAVPDLSFMVNYDSLGGDGLSLSSGMASSMHGDFMNGWNPEKLSALVKICVNADAKCGTTPGFVGG